MKLIILLVFNFFTHLRYFLHVGILLWVLLILYIFTDLMTEMKALKYSQILRIFYFKGGQALKHTLVPLISLRKIQQHLFE